MIKQPNTFKSIYYEKSRIQSYLKLTVKLSDKTHNIIIKIIICFFNINEV